MSEQGCLIRIGTDGTDVLVQWLLHFWAVPKPDLPLYRDHAVTATLGDGGQALRGRGSVTLAWDLLTDQEFERLNTAWAAVTSDMWLTVDKGWGEADALGSWVDVSGKPHRPTGSPRQRSDGKVFEDVRFHVANITVQNDPATGI